MDHVRGLCCCPFLWKHRLENHHVDKMAKKGGSLLVDFIEDIITPLDVVLWYLDVTQRFSAVRSFIFFFYIFSCSFSGYEGLLILCAFCYIFLSYNIK